MKGREKLARAREMFALLMTHARAMIDPTDPEMQPTAEAFEGIEESFHLAMADVLRDIDQAGRYAALLREYAARTDETLILIATVNHIFTDEQPYAADLIKALSAERDAAKVLADIGRDIDAATARARERAAGT